MLACFFVVPRDISLPLFSVPTLQVPVRSSFTLTHRSKWFSALRLFFGFEWIYTEALESPCWANYSTSTPSVSAQTRAHWSSESTCFLCRLRRARLFKNATCRGRTHECVSLSDDWDENDQFHVSALSGAKRFASPNGFSSLFMLRTAPVTQLDNGANVGPLAFF